MLDGGVGLLRYCCIGSFPLLSSLYQHRSSPGAGGFLEAGIPESPLQVTGSELRRESGHDSTGSRRGQTEESRSLESSVSQEAVINKLFEGACGYSCT